MKGSPRRSLRDVCLAVLVLAVLAPGLSHGQANRQARAQPRVDAGGLADAPVIVGTGLVFGIPAGITTKLWFTEVGLALDATVAWMVPDNSQVYLLAHGMFHLEIIETAGGLFLSPYVGAGVQARPDTETTLSLRFPLGLSLFPFKRFPVEFYAEMAPGVGVIPDASPLVGAGLGVRFYLPVNGADEEER